MKKEISVLPFIISLLIFSCYTQFFHPRVEIDSPEAEQKGGNCSYCHNPVIVDDLWAPEQPWWIDNAPALIDNAYPQNNWREGTEGALEVVPPLVGPSAAMKENEPAQRLEKKSSESEKPNSAHDVRRSFSRKSVSKEESEAGERRRKDN